MKVKEILSDAAEILGKSEIKNIIDVRNYSGCDSSSEELRLLLRCYNLVLNEITVEYYNLVDCFDSTAINGRTEYSSFPNQPIEILKVTDKNGDKIDFETFTTFLKTPKENISIKYTYAPERAEIEDEFVLSDTKIQPRIVIYGVIAEYYLTKGMYNEAQIYENRFKDSLLAAMTPKRIKRLKSRIWGL